jgi:methylated-DNA-[protein]-cysteine S-methyltransferase
METEFISILSSPVGPIEIRATNSGIRSIGYLGESSEERPNDLSKECSNQLREYFGGLRQTFDVPFALEGTSFEQSVWSELTRIPYGSTRSYIEIARKLDNPGAIRAVGRANGKNRLNIIVPCHRVIGSNGSLTGYGGGIPRKQWLLDHEAKVAGTRLL